MRDLVREVSLTTDDLILPLFVSGTAEGDEPIGSMPGVFRRTVSGTAERAVAAAELGIRAVILFGIPARKDAVASGAYAEDGIVQEAARAIRVRCPDLVIFADTCLCEYTDHGHCGLLAPDMEVDNDGTLELLGRVAVSQAEAGVDFVAPSGMMDGMVGAIRGALDEHDLQHVGVLSYAVKYASAFYGPFREAAQGAPSFGDRRAHQMDPANAREALREAHLDLEQGADLIMVKPALAYQDVIHRIREAFPAAPLVAYNVSGEYAMVKAASAHGWISERAVVLEILTGLKRAGADLVITYHAEEVAKWLNDR